MDKEKRKKIIIKEAISYGLIVILAILVAMFINKKLIVNAVVPTSSMYPTIQKDDRLIGNRLAYKKTSPKRGDIIIFPFPDDESQTFIKRVIGLPGETVEIKNGKVYINGEELDESAYLGSDVITNAPAGSTGVYYVPYGSYFVLGDNRSNSQDARVWQNKFVSEEKILAKAMFKYYKGFKKY